MRKLSLVMLTLIVALSFVACKIDTPSTPGGNGGSGGFDPEHGLSVPDVTGTMDEADFENCFTKSLGIIVEKAESGEYAAVRTEKRIQYVYDADGRYIASSVSDSDSETVTVTCHADIEGFSYFKEGVVGKFRGSSALDLIEIYGKPADSFDADQKNAILGEVVRLMSLEEGRSVVQEEWATVPVQIGGITYTVVMSRFSHANSTELAFYKYNFTPAYDEVSNLNLYTINEDGTYKRIMEVFEGPYTGVYDVSAFMN